MRSALDNLHDYGLPDGVSGPVARGDFETVQQHAALLEPRAAQLYLELSTQLRELLDRHSS